MTYQIAPRITAALGLTLLACDPRFSIDATIIVPDKVAAAYTPDQRGLLVVTIDAHGSGSEREALAVICGESGSYSASYGSFGHLPETDIHAWISPLPADDERPCGDVEFGERDGSRAEDASDADPQVHETITPASDGHAELTLAAP